MKKDHQPQPATAARVQRTDIQVLRALAVGGVILNHLFPHRLTGGYVGVDIFFVISGFLITSHLASELERTDKVRLGRFWARRARRLLPAALLTLAVTLVATLVWLPHAKWSQVMQEILASALYFQNWELAGDAKDYFASSQAPSPVTHFWSLSVEEQFYLVWPLVALLAWAVARRAGLSRRRVLTATMGAVAITSFAFAIWSVESIPNQAYFVTPGRAWEFAVGGVLGALGVALPRIPRGLAVPGWAALLVTMVVFDEGSGVPGALALVPVLACALVIWSGQGSGEHRALPLRTASWVGDISYALYLWHWPLIIFVPLALGRPMSPALALVILALTLVVAQVSTQYVEAPIRQGRWFAEGPSWHSLVPAGVAMAVVASAAWYVPQTLSSDLKEVQDELQALVVEGGSCVGAAAVDNDCSFSHVLSVANSDLVTIENSPYAPAWGTTCQVEPEDPTPAACEFGVPAAEASARIALVGDSHAGQWATPLDLIAREQGWNVLMHVKSSCVAAAGDVRASWSNDLALASCDAWRADVSASIAADESIDAVVVSGISRGYVSDPADGVQAGLREQWRTWIDAGKPVLVISDPPSLQKGVPSECLGATETVEDPCATPASEANTPDPLVQAAKGLAGARLWDATRYVCDRQCHAVVGGLPTFGDENHLLHYFTQTTAPMLEQSLTDLLAGDRSAQVAGK